MSGLSREGLIKAGWARGIFVNLSEHPSLLEELPSKLREFCEAQDRVFIVPVLYDCALIDMDFNREPWVQVIICSPCQGDPSFKNARSPRKIHLSCISDKLENELWMEVSALGFAQIEREALLTKSCPDLSLRWADSSLDCLLNWVAERFRQPTFPDAFNKRVAKKDKLLKKLWKSAAYVECCSGVYVGLSTHDELAEDIKYEVKIILTIPGTFKKRELAAVIKEYAPTMIEKIRSIFSSMDGIDLISVVTIPEGEFTKNEERKFKRYSLEYHTYNDSGDEAVLPSEFLNSYDKISG